MEVIRSGNSWKRALCNNCEALLVYNGADIKTDYRIIDSTLNPGGNDITVYNVITYIVCPECGKRIILDEKTETHVTPSLIGFTN